MGEKFTFSTLLLVLPLILGCDANAHHIIWRSSDINCRGETLLQFLSPRYWASWRGAEIRPYIILLNGIDLTLHSKGISSWIGHWRISTEPTLSDHRHIVYTWRKRGTSTRAIKNLRRTDRDTLEDDPRNFRPDFTTTERLEYWVEKLRRITDVLFQRSCPITKSRDTGRTPWWTEELQDLHWKVKRAFNRTRNTRRPEYWVFHK